MLNCFFGLSSYVTDNILCSVICSILLCLFRFDSYVTENTVWCIMYSMIKCFFDLSWCLAEKTNSRIMCSMLNSFVNLRSCLIEKTQTLLYYVLDANLYLQPQLIASLRKQTLVLCVRCLTVSSTSGYALLRKHAVVYVLDLNCFFNLSSCLTENKRYHIMY